MTAGSLTEMFSKPPSISRVTAALPSAMAILDAEVAYDA
jgi:hypothetical protein